MNNKVWLITGASQGLGLAIVSKVLREGGAVCAVTRSENAIVKAMGSESQYFLPFQLDIRNEAEIANCKARILEKFGRLDVLVNNAGYEQGGVLEYVTDKMMRDNFDINFFGALNMVRAFVPVFREQRSGAIINITSSAAFRPLAGGSTYCASKFALEGVTEALKKEMEPFGVHVCAVKPGGMNTTFLSGPNIREVQRTNSDYDFVFQLMREKRKYPAWENKNSDPESVAEMLYKLAALQDLPLNIFSGSDCLIHAREQLNFIEREVYENRKMSISVDYGENI